jgi:hypothetical protein
LTQPNGHAARLRDPANHGKGGVVDVCNERVMEIARMGKCDSTHGLITFIDQDLGPLNPESGEKAAG